MAAAGCVTCGGRGGDASALLWGGGVFECSGCKKCWVCAQPLRTAGIVLLNGNWVHTGCITCRCGDMWLRTSSVVREEGGRRVCLYCTGCECGVEKCTFARVLVETDRHKLRAQNRGNTKPQHMLVKVGGKLVVDVHRPCGECGEWCGRTDMLEMESPPAKKRCDKCDKCVHRGKDALFPHYSWNGVGSYEQSLEVEPIGHRECVTCSVCGKLAKDAPSTRNVWIEKDGVVTHAGCFTCEDPGCGKVIPTQKITRAVYPGEPAEKYVHIKCWNEHKKKRKADEKAAEQAERRGGIKRRKVE